MMDQGTAGRYRTIPVRVGRYAPPPPGEVSGLMFFFEWTHSGVLSQGQKLEEIWKRVR